MGIVVVECDRLLNVVCLVKIVLVVDIWSLFFIKGLIFVLSKVVLVG